MIIHAGMPAVTFRSYLKKVFWPNFFVGASFKILEILEYACGFKLGSAANLNQNPIFEMASNKTGIVKNLLPIEAAIKGAFRNIAIGFPVPSPLISKGNKIAIIGSPAVGPYTFAVIHHFGFKGISDCPHVGFV